MARSSHIRIRIRRLERRFFSLNVIPGSSPRMMGKANVFLSFNSYPDAYAVNPYPDAYAVEPGHDGR
jgi:hypothetical protein